MFISDFAIKRPIITVVAMLALVVFGLFALLNLQTDEFPDVAAADRRASAIPYPGASPETVEREIVDPIEEAISAISGVDSRSTASAYDGYAHDHRRVHVREGPAAGDAGHPRRDLRRSAHDLPTEMKEPILQRFDPTDRPIVSLALVVDRR